MYCPAIRLPVVDQAATAAPLDGLPVWPALASSNACVRCVSPRTAFASYACWPSRFPTLIVLRLHTTECRLVAVWCPWPGQPQRLPPLLRTRPRTAVPRTPHRPLRPSVIAHVDGRPRTPYCTRPTTRLPPPPSPSATNRPGRRMDRGQFIRRRVVHAYFGARPPPPSTSLSDLAAPKAQERVHSPAPTTVAPRDGLSTWPALAPSGVCVCCVAQE
jgi:hypothetical protein